MRPKEGQGGGGRDEPSEAEEEHGGGSAVPSAAEGGPVAFGWAGWLGPACCPPEANSLHPTTPPHLAGNDASSPHVLPGSSHASGSPSLSSAMASPDVIIW